jgi:hypothetical protein
MLLGLMIVPVAAYMFEGEASERAEIRWRWWVRKRAWQRLLSATEEGKEALHAVLEEAHGESGLARPFTTCAVMSSLYW